jgi:hypothetical protein
MGLRALPRNILATRAKETHVDWCGHGRPPSNQGDCDDLPPPSRGATIMTDKTIDLDLHRGMSAQHATDLRRLVSEVEANQAALRRGQEEVERRLLEQAAETWPQAAEKARYLLGLFGASTAGGDARISRLIANVLDDFDRLSR